MLAFACMASGLYFFPSGPKVEEPALPTASLTAQFLKLPLAFEKNEGQTNESVKYFTRGLGYSFFFTSNEMVMVLQREAQEDMPLSSSVLKMQFLGANGNALLEGFDLTNSKSNYFIGNEPEKWRTNIPNYAKVSYRGIYPGIDAVFYGNQQKLEYDLCVAPGANPNNFRFHVEGANQLFTDEQGNLHIVVNEEQEVLMHKPIVYQHKEHERIDISGEFILLAQNEFGFAIGPYDTSEILVIDPVLTYSTYLGGLGEDTATSIAVDSSGNTYVVGYTTSLDFPTLNPFQPSLDGSQNAFITKFNPTGSELIFSTYLGSGIGILGGIEFGLDIAIDLNENVYVTGITDSPSFPVTAGAFQGGLVGFVNAFMTKFDATGSALLYSTYLGGGLDFGFGIAVDSAGNAYVTGQTFGNFPTTPGAFQTSLGGFSANAFVSKIDPSQFGAASLIYSTYLGGSGSPINGGDVGNGIIVDTLGKAYVTGTTTSNDFPITPDAFQTMFGPSAIKAFVTKLNADGSALVYSTYLGGSNLDRGSRIALDFTGNAHVVGTTLSSDFPTTPSAFQSTLGSAEGNAFVAKLNAEGSALLYSTYLGGSGSLTLGDAGSDIAIVSPYIYVTGTTTSSDFPTTIGAFQSTLHGNQDVFISKLDPTKSATASLIYSTYFGGNDAIMDEFGTGIAVDVNGNAFVCGVTDSADFPITPDAFQKSLKGVSDAFVAKFAIGAPIITALFPTSGPTIGGTSVTITGTNFSEATEVLFGTFPAQFTIDSDQQITAISPPHPVGVVDVIVNALGGASTVTPADQFTYFLTPTETTLTVQPNPANFGETVTLTASVSSPFATGSVEFFDGPNSIGIVSLINAEAMLTIDDFSPGEHSLVAVYSGDANFGGSASDPVLLIVNQLATEIELAVSPNPVSFGETVNLVATVNPTGATGIVEFFDGANSLGTASLVDGEASLTVDSFAPGEHSLAAVYHGDENFSGSTSDVVELLVNQLETETELFVSPNLSIFGEIVRLEAHVSSSFATGTVEFFDGSESLGVVPLFNGEAFLDIDTLVVGEHALTAVYSGDVIFSGSVSPVVDLFVEQAPTRTILRVFPNPSSFGDLVTLAAFISPSSATGSVEFFDGTASLGSFPVIDGVAVFETISFAIGDHELEAIYSGDANFLGSISRIVDLIVEPAVFPPENLQLFQLRNRFASQTDYVNVLTWEAPTDGNIPVSYRIYRNAKLTKLLAVVSKHEKFKFKEHNRKKGKTYTYYIVSVDQFGNISEPVSVSISEPFSPRSSFSPPSVKSVSPPSIHSVSSVPSTKSSSG